MRTRQLYWRARAYSQGMFGALDNRLKPVYCPWQQRRNKGVYAVDIRAEVGFFAQLNWCVYIFAHCERFGLRPAVSLSSPFYTSRKGDNWLTYHFEGCALPEGQESLSADGVRISRVSTIGHLGMPTNYGEQMTLDDANRLLRKNLNVKKEIQDYVDSFIARHFSSKQVVGVHYRGTDKGAEAPPVTFEDVARTVWAYLRVNPVVEAIFVASDEEKFIDRMREEFSQVDVICHDDTLRSRDGTAAHTRVVERENYLKGREALINCLLLSRCKALIRTASFLSGWSSVFNPRLPVIMLNQPYDNKLWFPDAAIVRNALVQ